MVGAGLAGLTAARALVDSGHTVRVVDKARGVGGRAATRRIGHARADHGAQFFTVRTEAFARIISDAAADGAVVEWCRGFGVDDGHPRWRGVEGMTDLAKWMARDLDVTLSHPVRDLRDVPADGYVVTPPVPQSLALLSNSRMLGEPDLDDRLAGLRYDPTLAAMVVPDRSVELPGPGALQRPPDSALAFVADNAAKGVSPEQVITLHATADVSRRLWRHDDEEAVAALWEAAAPWMGGAGVTRWSLQRWRYSTPVTLWPEPCEVVSEDPPVVLAGDAFASARIEGAVCSGAAAASALMAIVR